MQPQGKEEETVGRQTDRDRDYFLVLEIGILMGVQISGKGDPPPERYWPIYRYNPGFLKEA